MGNCFLSRKILSSSKPLIIPSMSSSATAYCRYGGRGNGGVTFKFNISGYKTMTGTFSHSATSNYSSSSSIIFDDGLATSYTYASTSNASDTWTFNNYDISNYSTVTFRGYTDRSSYSGNTTCTISNMIFS